MPPLLSLLVERACGQVQSSCSSLGPPSSLTRGASRIWVISIQYFLPPSTSPKNIRLPFTLLIPTHVVHLYVLNITQILGTKHVATDMDSCPCSGPSRTPISLLIESRDPNPNPSSSPILSLNHLGQSVSVAFLPVTFSILPSRKKPSNFHSLPSHSYYQSPLSSIPSSTS